jgi:hypothetical protein
MKRILQLLCGGLMTGAVWAGPNTIPLYINYSSVTNVPQIDAEAFANWGDFFVSSTLPYDFMNVLVYTNRGTMAALPGFHFDHVDDLGNRSPAESFLNDLNASIQAFGDGLPLSQGGQPAILRIEADQIVNRGNIVTDTDGAIVIAGEDVDVRRSAMGIQPLIFGSGFHAPIGLETYYYPDEGITDEWWGLGEQDPRFLSSSIVQSFLGSLNGFAPPHNVTNSFGGGRTAFTLPNPMAFIFTNEVDPTNWIVQAVLASTSDPYLNLQANFFPSSQPTNFIRTATLQMQADLTNNLGGFQDSIATYLIDRLVSETNFTTLTNFLTGGFPLRPSTIEYTRNLPLEFAAGSPPNANIYRTNLADLIYNPGQPGVTNVTTNYVVVPNPPDSTNFTMEIVTNVVSVAGYAHDAVTNLYSGYAAEITNLVSEVPAVPGAGSTNSQGKVIITADNLNLERARIRGEGNVTVQARHVVSTRLLSMDVPNLLYDIGATNGVMQLESLAPAEVQRYAGSIVAWSAVWTNVLNIVTNSITNSTITNITIDPDAGPVTTITNDPGTNVFSTNAVNVGIKVTFVNADSMQTRYGTAVVGLKANSTNIYVADSTRVVQSLLFQASNLGIGPKGSLMLGANGQNNTITDWKVDHFPDLVRLTNDGVIGVYNEMILGADRETPYEYIEIRGTNAAAAHRYEVDTLVNSGLITSGRALQSGTNLFIGSPIGPIEIYADAASFDGGRIQSGGDLVISANTLKMRSSTNTAAREIVLDVVDSISDIGGGAAVRFETPQGIRLIRKPMRGDILGTAIALSASRWQLVSSVWAAEDRGVSAAGFENNVALGRLIISPQSDALIELRGLDGQNGLYVDYLEMGPTAMADLENTLTIDPSLTVYFADANMDFGTLTNTFPGRLHWVSSFAGPTSGMEVALPSGETILVNRGFRNSPTIDSDADGTANGFDLSPFDGPTITDFRVEDDKLTLTWRAAAGTAYEVEATGELPGDAWSWEVVREYAHEGTDTAEVSIEDTLPAGATQRYYRVSYTP